MARLTCTPGPTWGKNLSPGIALQRHRLCIHLRDRFGPIVPLYMQGIKSPIARVLEQVLSEDVKHG